MRAAFRLAAGALLVGALVPRASGEEPVPSPSPPAAEPPVAAPAQPTTAPERPQAAAEPGSRPRLRLDIEKHVQQREEAPSPIRFETSMEVIGAALEQRLEAHLKTVDLNCGPAGGVPTDVEMRNARYHPEPYLDYFALGQALVGTAARKLMVDLKKAKRSDRYYMYRIQHPDRVEFWLRERPLPASRPVPGVTVELVDTFTNLTTAVRMWRRIEQGLEGSPPPDGPPLPLWATSPCPLPQ